MLSIQETVDKTETQRKAIEHMLDEGFYDFSEHNLLKEQKPADRQAIMETLRTVPLSEFLARSGTAGIAGAAYLIPDKIYQVMFDSAVGADICDQISLAMVPADQIPGTTMYVDIAIDDSYLPKAYSSGGQMPVETIATTRATLDFSTAFGINFRITNDLIEDSQFDVIEMHLRNAGREMGEYATDLALTVLKTGTDGDGTINSDADAAGAQDDETLLSNVVAAYRANCADGYVSDTYILPHECWLHSIITDTTYSSYAQVWHDAIISTSTPNDMSILGCKIIFVDNLRASALNPDGDWSECISIMIDKDYALLTGRKRWLRIENYSDPVRDLVGATVTARQDSVTIYNDSIATLVED